MRPPVFRGAFDGELVVDNFAGGGGASSGIEAAIGRPPDIAINHDAEAIAMHAANHPDTKHYCENIWDVDPIEASGGRPVGLAWFSPDCTHFSRAKGTTPVKKEIRGLAWVVVRWAKTVRPRVIILENVEEFQTWGPVLDGRPDPAHVGETFREWMAELSAIGYTIDFRTLVAADYGAPTTRKRLFLVARLDGQRPAWPLQTHGPGRGERWRPAADIIDWTLPCPSIFDRRRPLAEATLRRIAAGIRRYVIESPAPFIVPVKSWGGGGNDARGIDLPMRTITASKRGEFAIVDPFLVRTAHGEVDASGKRRGKGHHDMGEPLPTVCASGGDFAMAAPLVVRHGHYSTITGAGLREGCGAGTFRGQRVEDPLATVCATNDKHLVLPFLAKHYGGLNGHQTPGKPVGEPMDTVTAQDHHALAAAFISKYHGGDHQALRGQEMAEPLRTVDTNNRFAEVRAFLIKYYGAAVGQQQEMFDPLHTVTSRARFGLVMVHGEPYQIVDIGMRMLSPGELFAAQGFPADYDITPEVNGKPLTKTAQIRCAGNSVCPPAARAIVAANAAPPALEVAA